MFTVPEKTRLSVYKQVRRIPIGMVTTYKQIAIATGISPRVVGSALRLCDDPSIPCHRVVNAAGRIAPIFGLNGPEEQKEKLLIEGIEFKNEKHVNLKNHLFRLG